MFPMLKVKERWTWKSRTKTTTSGQIKRTIVVLDGVTKAEMTFKQGYEIWPKTETHTDPETSLLTPTDLEKVDLVGMDPRIGNNHLMTDH